MKIGIFDSGVGGLILAKALRQALPQYDYVYLGDTKRVPYGNRSEDTVFEFTKQAVEHLLRKENCAVVIIACNTASARALYRVQKIFKHKKIIGVLVPAAEEAAKYSRVGVLATQGTVNSKAFVVEIKKVNKFSRVFQNPAPMLVPLAEAGETRDAIPFLKKYLQPLLAKKVEAVVLGCTHYPIFKREIRAILRSFSEGGKKEVVIISQDTIVPRKLKEYLKHHPEIEKKLSKGRSAKVLVTDETQTIDELVRKWFGKVRPKVVEL